MRLDLPTYPKIWRHIWMLPKLSIPLHQASFELNFHGVGMKKVWIWTVIFLNFEFVNFEFVKSDLLNLWGVNYFWPNFHGMIPTKIRHGSVSTYNITIASSKNSSMRIDMQYKCVYFYPTCCVQDGYSPVHLSGHWEFLEY